MNIQKIGFVSPAYRAAPDFGKKTKEKEKQKEGIQEFQLPDLNTVLAQSGIIIIATKKTQSSEGTKIETGIYTLQDVPPNDQADIEAEKAAIEALQNAIYY